MKKRHAAADQLRFFLAMNIKKERKRLGLTQEKLAEAADLSFQTVNDIEGCRMWVSDNTLSKLAQVLQVEAYQLLIPEIILSQKPKEDYHPELLLNNLEIEVISTIRKQFKEILFQSSIDLDNIVK